MVRKSMKFKVLLVHNSVSESNYVLYYISVWGKKITGIVV